MKKVLLLILTLAVLVSGCASSDDEDVINASQVVISGDHISVNYIGELDDGTVFDTSIEQVAIDEGLYNPARKYEPLEFIAGAGQMIQGFDEAVTGMAAGEKKTVEIPPGKAYGEYSSELVFDIPFGQFESANITPVVGEAIFMQGRPCTIINVSEGNVTLDCNHYLAGETLIFTIELVSIGSNDSNNS
ncbi:MAG: peptidylprolyl isomerase [Methanosarcinaceae archaeon]|nr:peptidylprolyl isomerase [Methanosarcinaceae archaeon]